MNAILGSTKPDPIGEILGTGYQQFSSHLGIDGLAKEPEPGVLHLLAVVSRNQGAGQLREFIAALKPVYRTICVWHIENPALYDALVRYKFTPEVDVDQFGDALKGLRWDKND